MFNNQKLVQHILVILSLIINQILFLTDEDPFWGISIEVTNLMNKVSHKYLIDTLLFRLLCENSIHCFKNLFLKEIDFFEEGIVF